MSLLLNGAKTAIIAGTVLQCIEVYTGESYTFPFAFTDNAGDPVNITSWTMSTTVKWYTCGISYPTIQSTVEDIIISNLTLVDPQPTPNPPTGMVATITDAPNGEGFIYVPSGINGGQTISISGSVSLLAIINLEVSRTNAYGKTDVNIEPIGMIIRYI